MVVADVVVSIGVITAFYALIALGLNIKYGHTGLLDFGHVGFFLIGAYTAALFTLPPDAPGDFTKYLIGLNLPWVVGALAGMVLAGAVGAFVALPTLRLREDYLAITLLGVAVILQRVVQAEPWLANGPDALRGINQPLAEFFPVASQSAPGAVVSFFVAGGIWALSAYVLGLTLEKTLAERDPERTLAGRVHWLTTFGIDRRLKRLNPDGQAQTSGVLASIADIGPSHYVGSALGAGLIVGSVAAVLTLVATAGLLAWGTVVSLYTWVAVIIGIRRYCSMFTWFDFVVTLAMGTAYMLTLAPLFFLESDVTGIPLTLLAIVVVTWIAVYLKRTLSPFSENPFRYGALIGLWFGIVWYFPLQVLSDLQRGAFATVGSSLFDNIVWVLSLAEAEPLIGYSRFLLFLFGALTFVAVYASDLIIESPFGRVLRAIRDDEQVVNSLGKDPFMFKVQSMAIGSAITGLAGALAAMYFQTLVFTMFSPAVTFIAFLMVFLGGVANNRGMIVGAGIFWAFQTATVQIVDFVSPGISERVQAFRLVLMGLGFLLILYYRPQGLLAQRSAAEVTGE